MPRYHYECDSCNFALDVRHSMNDNRTECPKCSKQTLVRILPIISAEKSMIAEKQIGSEVKRAIEEAKQMVKEDKGEYTKEYNP